MNVSRQKETDHDIFQCPVRERPDEMYAPYYFESHITENNVAFDYCIHPGRGGESNALALLRAFGFPDEIIQDANQTISSL